MTSSPSSASWKNWLLSSFPSVSSSLRKQLCIAVLRSAIGVSAGVLDICCRCGVCIVLVLLFALGVINSAFLRAKFLARSK